MENDKYFMRRCLELGSIALENGDAPVGSLIVLTGEIIGESFESVKSIFDPAAHAELLAIRAACKKLSTLNLTGAELYTNVEPCVMCAFAIRQTGISRVVFGMPNYKIGGANSEVAVLTDAKFPAKFAPPEICENILPAECEMLWQEFLTRKTIQDTRR